MSHDKQDIRAASFEEIAAYCAQQGWQAFRARQLYAWIWQKGATSFDVMTNLSHEMRDVLQQDWEFRPLTTDIVQKSTDGTIKYRLQLYDGHKIEAVLIPVVEESRYTVCVSSQVGCSLSCAFCATGQMKRERNLDPAEIVDQVRIVDQSARQTYGHGLTNIVYMGMGEPLLNYRNVLQSIEHITSPNGLGMSPRRITVSTAGIAKAIRRLAEDKVRFNLALSLHAADDSKRTQIMPINAQNNLEVLMDALRTFYRQTRGRISYEYIAFQGFNDTIEDAEQLAALCKQFPVRVNIIEYNPIEGLSFVKSDQHALDRFAQVLTRHGVTVTIRRSRGKDIDAACGQLANK
ncbi:MAG: 23S rRNA (adenine(2503)-C(2))-methyltransferase RlmN [Saprospiraceae bacterium]|nr:23S rRNA (adenine(2503)-C(2))-methyltransferase RlmN [Saprospiraceae bacterium]